jgi:ABC-type nickel/cobalt efflux system permease component RcnA
MLAAGLILVLVFSVGLALVLSTIGLILVATKGYMRARQKEHKGAFYRFMETKVPVIGALGITLIGFTMVLMALLRLGVLDMSTFTA